ncbi:MAG TPA: FAD-dependent oxidoreductase [Steroidobacteraceae bacterium]|nr:FAD-dependent oxidoreductase [Steroidobacteraceae bacterium]
MNDGYDHGFDVVVVGSGAAGLTAAWAAARAGLTVVILEKAAVFGGNTALSGGGAWMPNSPTLLRHGQQDDPAAVLKYLRALAPMVDPERQRRFLQEAPQLHRALEAELPYFRNAFEWYPGYSDYHPHLGGNPLGRGLWPAPIEFDVIGEEAARVRPSRIRMDMPKGTTRLWIKSRDFKDVAKMHWEGWALTRYRVFIRFTWRILKGMITRRYIATSGKALVIRLRKATQEAGVPLWLNTPLKSLIAEGGAVVGVNAERDGKPIRIEARRGVIMAAGGFEFNTQMRARYQPLVAENFSSGAPSNTGDGIRAGEAVGAATDLMDGAWWMPALVRPEWPHPSGWDRQSPYQFIVNGAGARFVNEATNYVSFGQAQIEGQRTGVSHNPVFMITDHHGWTHNIIYGHMPGKPIPQELLDYGSIAVADTLAALARKIGVPPHQLEATAERFNEFARNGRDLDFHRGDSPYDRYYGNPRLKNPNLAQVKQPPFYAIKLGLSDLGTQGGLLTNPNAQVLDKDGRVIPGLYAAGNSSASIMGYSYAGAGATIGPAMTFGWIAANTCAGLADTARPLDQALAPPSLARQAP